MAKGRLNSPWIRLLLLVSLLWMGVCWYGATQIRMIALFLDWQKRRMVR